MPGRRLRGFRSGDLAEDFGLFLLKGIAAVAEVARQEDFGLDAIANLLRLDDDHRFFYAEDSFVVQLKSASVNEIEYRDHEFDWLLSQTQPMFIGIVSLEKGQIRLYPTIHVNQAALALHLRAATIRFGRSNLPPFLAGQEWLPWVGLGEHAATVWLGDPLLEWSIGDMGNRDFSAAAYDIVKTFLQLARRELDLLSLKQSSVISWKTNDALSIVSQVGLMTGGPDDLREVADRCVPCLKAIMLRATSMPNDSGHQLLTSLIGMAAALRQAGVEVEADNLFGKMSSVFQRRTDPGDSKGLE